MVTNNKKSEDDETTVPMEGGHRRVKFEVYGEEMVEKEVKLSGNSGRVYLPPDWVGHQVKIIRIE
jgi:putative transposon-encoded protein